MERPPRRYLLYASLSYAYAILRPLQEEIRRRGDEAAWFLEPSCPDMLLLDERRISTLRDAIRWNPIAIFAPGNHIPDFLPGVKVAVFHGYPMKKRIEKIDDHFTIRGWFDIYCTQGPSSTPYFRMLEKRHGFFKVYETGWTKADSFFSNSYHVERSSDRPVILYSPTFTKGISSAWDLLPTIKRLAATRQWDWIITFHPKLDDQQLIDDYQRMADKMPNVEFARLNKGLETFLRSDVMLCDSSSITVEYIMLGKPVVTYRNTHPGPHLIDVRNADDIGQAIETALTRPPELMKEIDRYTSHHEAHRDGHNSSRVLEAVDDFIAHHAGHLHRKPLNLIRRLKLRLKLRYYHL